MQIASIVFLLFAAIAMPLDQPTDVELRREWQDIQTNEDGQQRADWWQQLDSEQLRVYLQAGADANVTDKQGWTPLHSAARDNSDAEVLSTVLQAGADVEARNKSGGTPLHWAAAENSNIEILNTLIAAGAPVNARDRFGWLPIHTAAETSSNPEVIDALLKAGSKRKKRAYFVLFSPKFLLKHNSKISESDKKTAMALLKATE